jgi:hypothetical protein
MALVAMPRLATAQIQIFSTGQYGTPETISRAPIGFGSFGGEYFIPDARLDIIWVVPATGGSPTKFADTGGIALGGLFLPSDWGDYSGKFLLNGNGAFDSNGAMTFLSPGQPGNLGFAEIAPNTFGSYGGQLFVADEAGTNIAVWRVAPPSPGHTAPFQPFRDNDSYRLGILAAFGLEFTPPDWGTFDNNFEFGNKLLVSDGGISVDDGPRKRVSYILALDPVDENADHLADRPFATILLRDNPDGSPGQFGLRQMLLLPDDFLVPSLGANGLGKLLLVSVTGSGQGGGVFELLAFNSLGEIKGHLITGSVTSKFDPRGMILTGDGHILISDAADPIWIASPRDFAPGRGPACSVISSVSTPSLWPPNHNLVKVGLGGSSGCPGATSVSVFSDEDDQADTGDGNFSPDARDIAPVSLRLRSERSGNGDGRVYLVVAKATDASGNVAASCNTVVVPKSQSKKDQDSVNAQAAAAKAYCLAHTGAPPPGYFVIGDGPVVGPKQ